MTRMMLGFSAAKPPANPTKKSIEQKNRLTRTTIGGRLAAGKNLLTIDAGLSSGGHPGRLLGGGRVT
jgi:hypothetical protein